MAEPLRVVPDTNLYIMARLSPGGYTATWLQAAPTSAAYRIYSSPAIMAELKEKLVEKFEVDPDDADEMVADVQSGLTMVVPTQTLSAVPDDPDDNIILECAVEAKANLVVSNDHHLYDLGQYEGIGIMRPKDLKYMFPDAFPGLKK